MRCATENSKHQIYSLSQAKEDETERKKKNYHYTVKFVRLENQNSELHIAPKI